jgi:hypothetical protein
MFNDYLFSAFLALTAFYNYNKKQLRNEVGLKLKNETGF